MENTTLVLSNSTTNDPCEVDINLGALGSVLWTALLIAFLILFGSWRLRSNSLMPKYSIWVSYILSTYFTGIGTGLMKSTSCYDEVGNLI